MSEFYNKHYISVDGRTCIVDGWSDGPHPEKDTTGAICVNEQGGYQFRLNYSVGFIGNNAELSTLRTEENPTLYTMDGIPLYKWGDGVAIQRTDEEIEADRAAIPEPPPSPMERLRADVDLIKLIQYATLQKETE